jgi:hypothetical protein
MIVFAGIPGSEVRCGDPIWVLGCNMVGHHCKCAEVPVCPGEEAPFSFTSREECEMNLAVMLAHEQSNAPPQGMLQVTDFYSLTAFTGSNPGTWTAKPRTEVYLLYCLLYLVHDEYEKVF